MLVMRMTKKVAISWWSTTKYTIAVCWAEALAARMSQKKKHVATWSEKSLKTSAGHSAASFGGTVSDSCCMPSGVEIKSPDKYENSLYWMDNGAVSTVMPRLL